MARGIVRDLMQQKVRTVTPETSVPDLERIFLREGVGGLPVVERDGRLVGVVSRSDVIRQLSVEQSLGESVSDYYRDQTDDAWPKESATAIGRLVGGRMRGHRVRDVMRTDLVTASPEEPLHGAARRLLDHRIHRLLVVESGRLVGILSSMDFVRMATTEAERESDSST